MEAGWQADPSGRHQERWFDGTTWSSQVRDHGVVNDDPVGIPSVAAVAAVPVVTHVAAAPPPPVAPVPHPFAPSGPGPSVVPLLTSSDPVAVSSVVGGVAGAVGVLVATILGVDPDAGYGVGSFLSRSYYGLAGVWLGIASACIAAALAAWPAVAAGQTGRAARLAAIAGAAGLYAGMAVGALRSYAVFDQYGPSNQSLSWVPALALLGGLVGLASCAGSASRRLALGAAGGLLGGLVVGPLVWAIGGDEWSVVIGSGSVIVGIFATVLLGAAVGCGTALMDRAVRPRWLRFVSGPLAGQVVSVHRPRVTVGTATKAAIGLPPDPAAAPIHFTVAFGPRGIVIEPGAPVAIDGVVIGTPHTVRSGVVVTVGSSAVEVGQKERR